MIVMFVFSYCCGLVRIFFMTQKTNVDLIRKQSVLSFKFESVTKQYWGMCLNVSFSLLSHTHSERCCGLHVLGWCWAGKWHLFRRWDNNVCSNSHCWGLWSGVSWTGYKPTGLVFLVHIETPCFLYSNTSGIKEYSAVCRYLYRRETKNNVRESEPSQRDKRNTKRLQGQRWVYRTVGTKVFYKTLTLFLVYSQVLSLSSTPSMECRQVFILPKLFCFHGTN